YRLELIVSAPRRGERIIVIEPVGIDGIFSESLEKLLGNNERLHAPPQKFYIEDLDYLHPHEKERIPAKIDDYLATAELAKLFEGVSDYAHSAPDGSLVLVFVHHGKLEIKV